MSFIDSKKLLNASNSGSKIVAQPKMFLVPIRNTEYKKTIDLSEQIQDKNLTDIDQEVINDIKIIREKVVKIEDVLKKTIKINVKKIQFNKREDENKKRTSQENKLEKKEKKGGTSLPKISIPGMSFVDRIKQFLGTVFTGFLVLKIFKLLPKLKEFLDYIKPVTTFIKDFVSGIFDKFVTTIDFGYKLVNDAQSKIKELFGDSDEKKFENFTGTFTKFMNLAIIAGMATMGGQDPLKNKKFNGPQKRGFDKSGRRVSQTAQDRYRSRHGDKKFKERFGDKNLNRSKTRTNTLKGVNLKGNSSKFAAKRIGRIAGKFPLVGPLIDFGIRALIFKEPIAKAAAGAVGAGVGQALGTWLGGMVGGIAGSVVPILGTLIGVGAGSLIGGIIGGIIGDQIGASLYNVAMKSNSSQIESRSEGGQVGYKNSKEKDQYKKPKKIAKLKVDKTVPGKSTGQNFLQNTYGTSDLSINPLSYMLSSANILKRQNTSMISKIMALGIDLNLGQKPSSNTKKSIAKTFGGLFDALMDPYTAQSYDIIRNVQGLSRGGEVEGNPPEIKRRKQKISYMLMQGIEKSIGQDLDKIKPKIQVKVKEKESKKVDKNTTINNVLGGLEDVLGGIKDFVFGKSKPNKGGTFNPLSRGTFKGGDQSFNAPRGGGTRKHAGVDITENNWIPGSDPKIPVVAIRGGLVLQGEWKGGQTYMSGCMIFQDDGYTVRYLHMEPFVRPGDRVVAGQKIGRLVDLRGPNGDNTHLHLELYHKGKLLNPTNYVQTLQSGKSPKAIGPGPALPSSNIKPEQVIPIPKGAGFTLGPVEPKTSGINRTAEADKKRTKIIVIKENIKRGYGGGGD